MVTSSDPLIAFDPDHAPEAEHEVELVEDQVRDITVSRRTDEEDEERLAVGLGSGAGALPPPPPPPHAAINSNVNTVIDRLFFCISDSLKSGIILENFISNSLSYFYGFCAQTKPK